MLLRSSCLKDAHIIFHRCGIFFIHSFFLLLFPSPILISRRLDVYHYYHTWCANLQCRSETPGYSWNTGRKTYAKKSLSAHHSTTLSGYIFAAKAYIENQKKNVLNSNISSTCPHNVVKFGPQRLRSVGGFWAPYLANFNRFRVLASLLHRRSTEVNQTLHDVWPSSGLVYSIWTFLWALPT